MSKASLPVLVAVVACAMPALGKPPLERLVGEPVPIEPLRIARAAYENGKIVQVGEWIPYAGGGGARSARYNAPLWDCYGRGDGPTSTWQPGTHGEICGGADPDRPTDEGSRWAFGYPYHNPSSIDNIESFVGGPCREIDEIDGAFYIGGWVRSIVVVAHFIFEEFTGPDPGTGLCTDPALYTVACGGSGVLLDLGWVFSPQFGYVAYRVDGLIGAGIGMRMPADDNDGDGLVDGSHAIFYLSRDEADHIIRHPGPIQPALWGTGEDTGELGRPGTHGPWAYDDDDPADGAWSNPAECSDYSYPEICPPTLGKMVAFLAPFCPADYNRDGFVDGLDSDLFSNDFESPDPLAHLRADINDDNFVDGLDADLFYNEFESPCP